MRAKIYCLIVLAALLLLSNPAASKTTFGSGNSEPLPNLIDIDIYNVSGLSDSEQRTGGDLLASGLNKTFQVNQSDTTSYRFEFTVRNDGDQDWPINSSDTLFHDGLNSTWNVTQIWYETTQLYENGTFQSGRVKWNTSLEGTLATGSTMTAGYVVKIDSNSSQEFQQQFKVNDTSENAGSEDFHSLDFNKLGFLKVNLTNPLENTILTQNRSFFMNASLECVDGECGSVEVLPRYNQSATADTAIPSTESEPFYLIDSQQKTCQLDTGTCNVSWNVNATGDTESFHLLDTRASSSYSRVEANDSEDRIVQINTAIVMDISFETVDFGLLNPGQQNRSANGNDQLAYNITIDDQSTAVDSLWFRATALENQSNSYSIGPSNLSYAFQNDISAETRLSSSYREVRTGIEPGTILNTFFWLDIPFGIAQADYRGQFFVKANSTG